MSREEIKNVLIRLTEDGYWADTTGFEYALGQANDEIERLLADEREKVLWEVIRLACPYCKDGQKPEIITHHKKSHMVGKWLHSGWEDADSRAQYLFECTAAPFHKLLDLTKPEKARASEGKG